LQLLFLIVNNKISIYLSTIVHMNRRLNSTHSMVNRLK